MALIKIEEDGTTRTQFTIASSSAGSSGSVYTVPKGKVFNGYLAFNAIANTYTYFSVNGVTLQLGINGTYETRFSLPIYLGEGDVIKNVGTQYFILTGYEE